MKKLTVLTLAPASLFVAASAIAAPPAGFSYDNFTVTGGTVTLGASDPCVTLAATCVNLEATGNGILQQRVTTGTDTYFRTIIVNEGVTSTTPTTLEFRGEDFIDSVDSSGNYTARNIIVGAPVIGATVDEMKVMAEVSGGTLESTLGHVILDQEQNLRSGDIDPTTNVTIATTGNMDFHFHENGSGYLELNVNNTGLVPGLGGGNEGSFTVRHFENVTAAGTLSLPANSEPTSTLAYAVGEDLQVVWMEQAFSGNGSQLDRVLGSQAYNKVDANGLPLGTEILYANDIDGPGLGVFPATNTGPGTQITSIGPWDWNSSLFGTAPVPYNVNSLGTGVVTPTSGTFANDFTIP